MTFLPIVDRELRVRARQKMTHRFRVGSAFVAIILVIFMLFMAAATSSPQSIGQPMFHVLSWLAFAYCLMEGARTTADCLSEEKRNGTLGLLFLTDLRGYDVVLGKFFATSLNSFYALLAILPPLALPILIGGVTGAEFWRLALMLLTTLFFSLCTGMLVSAVSHLERRALGTTLAMLFGITLMPLILLWQAPKAISWMKSLSPAVGFTGLFDSSYSVDPEPFVLSVWVLNGLSIVMLAATSIILPRVWGQREVTAHRSWIEALSDRIAPAGGKPNRRERWLVNVNPVLWLAVLQQPSVRLLWMIVSTVGVAGLGSWVLVAANYPPSASVMGSITSSLLLLAVLAHLAIAVCVITTACHFFADARTSGALELLLCTPLSVTQMVEGHRSALKRLFGPPIITLVAIEFVVGLGHVILGRNGSGGEGVVILGTLAVCLPILVLDLYAAGEYGLWLGLNSKKSTHAVTKTALYVIILPGFALFCCWPVFSIIKDLILINVARDQLRRRFRAVVAERFTEADKPDEPIFRLPMKPKGHLPSVLPRQG